MAATTSSARSVADFSRSAFAVGSRVRRSRAQGYVPGPSAPVPGAITPEGALAKAAHAMVAGQVNRSVDDAANRAQALSEARQQQKDLEAHQTFMDAHDPATRAARITEDVTARRQAEIANPLPDKGTEVGVEAVPDLKPYFAPGTKLKLADVSHYRALHGLNEYGTKPKEERRVYVPYTGRDWPETSSVVSDYMGMKPGAPPKRSGGKYDAIEENERAALAGASAHYEDTLKQAKGAFKATPEEVKQFVLGITPQRLLDLPEVKAAHAAVTNTRGSNTLHSLARATQTGTYEAITQALAGFYTGDELKSDRRVLPVRKAAVIRGASLARTRGEVDALFDTTNDPSDPLNADPEVTQALQTAKSRLPE